MYLQASGFCLAQTSFSEYLPEQYKFLNNVASHVHENAELLNMNTVFSEPELMKLQHLSRTFIHSLMCNDDGNVCSDPGLLPASFLQKTLSGNHTFLSPPVARLSPESIQHYLQCKSDAPFTTSACIIVPKCSHQRWNTSCMA